nr:MAG TPA: hypothetical protein [Caudoviricetes sp.]
MSLSFKNKKQNVYVSAYTFRYGKHKHGTLKILQACLCLSQYLFSPLIVMRYFFPPYHYGSPFDSYTTTGSMLHSIT